MGHCRILKQSRLLQLFMQSDICTWQPPANNGKEKEVQVATTIILMAEARTERVASHMSTQFRQQQQSYNEN